MHPITWWEDWATWIEPRAGKKIKPPSLGSKKYPHDLVLCPIRQRRDQNRAVSRGISGRIQRSGSARIHHYHQQIGIAGCQLMQWPWPWHYLQTIAQGFVNSRNPGPVVAPVDREPIQQAFRHHAQGPNSSFRAAPGSSARMKASPTR